MKINPSRKSTHTIMNNAGGKAPVKVYRTINGVEVVYIVPEKHMFNHNRAIKKYGIAIMENYFANIINSEVLRSV